SGSTARMIAKYRPDAPILGVTPDPATFRRLALVWGVRPLLIGPVRDTDEMLAETISAVTQGKLVPPGRRGIVTAGVPVGIVGTTNLIKVHVIGQPFNPMNGVME